MLYASVSFLHTGSAIALNIFKCSLATFLFIITISIIGHSSSALYMSSGCGMLVLSSLLGIVIGDVAWLQALQLLGARRVILVDSLKPFLAAILGYFILDESLSPVGVVGMCVTIVGVVIVSLESVHENTDSASEGREIKTEVENSGGTTKTTSYSAIDKMKIDGNMEFELSPIHAGESSPADGESSVHRSDTEGYSNCEMEDSTGAMNNCDMDSCGIASNDVVTKTTANSDLKKGYSFAIMNVIFDAYGAMLTKQYGIIFTVSEINLIRFGFAALTLGSLSAGFKLYYMFVDQKIMNSNIILMTVSGDVLTSPMHSLPPHDTERSEGEGTAEHHTVHVHHDIAQPNAYGEPLTSEENNPTSTSTGTATSNWYEFPSLHRFDWLKIAIGVIFVTYTCPSLFNYALFNLKLGLAITITSLGPIFSIPLVYVMKKEKTSLRAMGGSLLSFAGVAILCMSERE
jgi:drug/metabolite transporter (DMT)-like permease